MLRHLPPDRKQVDDDHAAAAPRQILDDVRPDESGASGDDDHIAAGQASITAMVRPWTSIFGRNYYRLNRLQGAAFLTTMPVITGPVIVFSKVKNFCSSLSRALAT